MPSQVRDKIDYGKFFMENSLLLFIVLFSQNSDALFTALCCLVSFFMDSVHTRFCLCLLTVITRCVCKHTLRTADERKKSCLRSFVDYQHMKFDMFASGI